MQTKIIQRKRNKNFISVSFGGEKVVIKNITCRAIFIQKKNF